MQLLNSWLMSTKQLSKRKQYNLKFQPIEKQSKLVVYVDAAFGNSHDEGSQILFSLAIQMKKLI